VIIIVLGVTLATLNVSMWVRQTRLCRNFPNLVESVRVPEGSAGRVVEERI